MFIFKLFTFNNIICYVSYFIMFIFIFFILYKYLYLEQTVYLLSNKVNKLEIEFNNPNVYNNSNSKSSNSALDSAEIIMNEIFNDGFCSNNSCQFTSSTSISPASPVSPGSSTPTTFPTPTVSATKNNNHEEIQEDTVQIVNEIFDLKKDINDDKESIISANVGGGHATKKALMKLSIDKLKAKCEERKLSTEGTKNQLADKIIVHDNTVEIADIIDD
jgi:hypothetical protein